MALETLKDVKEIGEFEVTHFVTGQESISKLTYIVVNRAINTISFILQDGPIKEVGVNGCQVDTLIEAAKLIIEGLNKKFPCQENYNAISRLEDVLMWLDCRKKNREQRGVEGLNKE